MLEAGTVVTLQLLQPLINHPSPSEDQVQTGSH